MASLGELTPPTTSTPTTPKESIGLTKIASRRSNTPIIFSQSTARRRPQPIEKKLECTLEELCVGCVKKMKITRDVISNEGYAKLVFFLIAEIHLRFVLA